jgi:hypothetical protein
MGCAGTGNPDNSNDNASNSNVNANDNASANDNTSSNDNGSANDNGGGPGGMPFGTITGTEELKEGTRSDAGNGETSMTDERFTASWTLTPTSADEQQIFINDELTTEIFGDIEGQAQLFHEESGTDVNPELECPTTTNEGSVEWDIDVTGSYSYIPALGTIRLTTHATNVSSPEYQITFTTPGCPEFDSQSPAQYIWQGPGQGTWGFVDIVLENGHYENHLDNPLADDLGAEDFYDIEANVGATP